MGVVLKYGGTSVQTPELIKNIAQYIKQRKSIEDHIVIVVSAMGKNTDYLLELASQVSSKQNTREIASLLATGEQQTSALMSLALQHEDLNAISLTGFQAGFQTTNDYTKGIIKDIDISRIKKHLEDQFIVVVAGFQGITSEGDITTLGRGGSDTSAVALAAKLGFSCEIYTDVDGIYTVDPRKYKHAKKIEKISYSEMMEMASKGSGVIETRAVELAKKYNVPLYLAKSLSEKGSGTYMIHEENILESKPITGISITEDVSMITLQGNIEHINKIKDIFNSISNYNINLDMISQNVDKEGDLILSFSIDQKDLQTLHQCIQDNQEIYQHFQLEETTDLVKIALVGLGMASNFGVAANVFDALSSVKVPYLTVSTSEISISTTIYKVYLNDAVNALSKRFNL